MIYRLLAINVDGTLLTNNGRIHKSTKQAIAYVQEKGVYVTLVTSRSYSSVKKIAKALELSLPLVSHRGAYISSAIDHPIFVQRIGEDLTKEIVRFLEGFSCQIRLVHEDFILANKLKGNRSLLGKTVYSLGESIEHVQQFVQTLSETLLQNPLTPPNIEVRFDRKIDVEDVLLAMKQLYDEIEVFKTNDVTLQITPKNATKLSGLTYLGEYLNISNKQMVVIGNALDDIPMIEAAGLGVAMGNAPFSVKRAADWVTRSNNEHGVAYMVKEHFRKQQPIEFLRKMNIIK